MIVRNRLLQTTANWCVLLGVVCSMFSGCILLSPKSSLPPAPYTASVPLTGQVVHSPDGDMIATIPQGWILLDTENKVEASKILVFTDTSYSGVVFFSVFPTTPGLLADVQQDGIEVAARKSYERLKAKTHSSAVLISSFVTFGVDDRPFCSYEYTTDHNKTRNRVVVFYSGKHFYECVASQISTDEKAMMSFPKLCDAQQSLVNTIRW